MPRRYLLPGLTAFCITAGGAGTRAQIAAPGLPKGETVEAPVPVGVFGVDMPSAGGFVVSLLPSFARLQGNQIGTNSVTPQYIVTNVPSAYTPVGKHLLRLVPDDLTIDSQALSVAYGYSNNLTLVAATALVEKSVTMQTFKGLIGTTPLGVSVGSTQGLGDSALAAIVRIYSDPVNRVSLNMGFALPTGSTTDNISLLLPNNTIPEKRGFYGMQPGAGTIDALPGISYSGRIDVWSWGLAYRARLPLDNNAQGYHYGALNEVNAWSGYSWLPGIETTFRLNGTIQGAIQGSDPAIRGYAQGADPLYYGGQQLSVFSGAIVSGHYFSLPAAQVGVEAGVPVYQQINGPQLARDWQVNLALRYKF
jgi:hypothetical protein